MFEIIMVALLLLVVPALAILLPNKNDPGLSYPVELLQLKTPLRCKHI